MMERAERQRRGNVRPLPKPFDLTGRTALITGAGGLLGAQHAAALAEVGARVILSDIDWAAALRAQETVRSAFPEAPLLPMALDVTAPAAVAAAAADLERQGIAVDILINNAAIDPKVGATGTTHASRLEVFALEQWNLEIAVGLTGAMLCARAFGAPMAERGRGVILNIASDLGVIAPDQRLYRVSDAGSEAEQPVKPVTYSVIKHGLIGLTKYLATYWADRGVRVNALSPGGVFNGQARVFVDRIEKLIPLARMAAVGEYRAAVQFLCSDAAGYMTGQNVIMDGGRSAW
jgi:NAD(P)-dependent dehydrogenase (short-subunit alcohol dehydrogenase family)